MSQQWLLLRQLFSTTPGSKMDVLELLKRCREQSWKLCHATALATCVLGAAGISGSPIMQGGAQPCFLTPGGHMQIGNARQVCEVMERSEKASRVPQFSIS